MVCQKNKRSNLFSVLSLLDAKLEIRSSSSSKWISINHLFNDNVISLLPGEIITKIKMYLEDYDINIYREIDSPFASLSLKTPQSEDTSFSMDSWLSGNDSQNEDPISFSALVSLTKKNINFIKFIFNTSDTFVIRSKEIESNITGQNIPLNDKLTTTIISQFSEYMDKKYNTIKDHRKNIIVNTLDWFIKELDYFTI
jgi:CO/xanthine dehydrogenase FAD-binding subunit